MVSAETKQAIDRMFYEVGQFPQMLLDTVETDFRFRATSKDVDNVLLIGMGGSGIASDIARDCVAAGCPIPVSVLKHPALPEWAGERTLAAVSSYSGNTRETMGAYSQAMSRNCRVVVFTHGGRLLEEAERNKQPVFRYVSGFQPRSALPAGMAGYAMLIDGIAGTALADEIRRTAPDLQRLAKRYSKPGSLAQRISESLGDRTPVIYCPPDIPGTGVRWKGQFNENSKVTAGLGSIDGRRELPEWSRRGMSKRYVPVFLCEEEAPPDVKAGFDACIRDVRSRGADAKVVMVKGSTVLQKTLYAILLGDYVSLFLAKRKGVDPMNVPTIKELKKMQSDALDRG